MTPERLFSPLIGQLVWEVTGGYGTFITMEFGAPHLSILEPVQPKRPHPERIRRALERRKVIPTGDWHFWIECAEWQIFTANGSTSSAEERGDWWKPWLLDISGQHLLSVQSERPGELTLDFDMGGRIEIRPDVEIDADVWSLYLWQGEIWSCQHDGTIVRDPSREG